MLLLGGVVIAPRALQAQQKPMPVVGYLSASSAPSSPNEPFLAAFRQGLSEMGYVEGQNLAIEYRSAENNHDRLPALAADVLRAQQKAMPVIGYLAGGSGGRLRWGSARD